MARTVTEQLLDACDAYHEALDRMFAMMIVETREHRFPEFIPSKSGQPWKAIQDGLELRQRVRAALSGREERPTEYPQDLWKAACIHALGMVAELGNDGSAERYIAIRDAFLDGARYMKRQAALDELVKTSEEMGLYDDSKVGTTDVNK